MPAVNAQGAERLIHASEEPPERIINQPYSFLVSHKKDNWNLLSNLCDKYGSDKGQIRTEGQPYTWAAHTYTDFYGRLFDHCRQHVVKVFECGIGSNNKNIPSNMGVNGKPGASLRVWCDYFPNSTVYAVDIDKDILFQTERIKTSYLDQTDPESIREFWNEFDVADFDLMVDDGLHAFHPAITLFENSISRLSDYGVYVIEDVSPHDLQLLEQYFSDKDYKVDFVQMYRPHHALENNSLVVVRQ